MAPLTPTWTQPSHAAIQEVITGPDAAHAFTSRSVSRVALPPFARFARLAFPPCSRELRPTYATVQMGRAAHLNLNSDLVYINHGCDPSLIFDMASLSILAGPRGLRPGDELTFFYPSTEWAMAQPFDCFCGAPSCCGNIAGARDMSTDQLAGLWLNAYIRDMLEERDAGSDPTAASAEARSGVHGKANGKAKGNSNRNVPIGASTITNANGNGDGHGHGNDHLNGKTNGTVRVVPEPQHFHDGASEGAARKGPTSRELSGEMGGDTTALA